MRMKLIQLQWIDEMLRTQPNGDHEPKTTSDFEDFIFEMKDKTSVITEFVHRQEIDNVEMMRMLRRSVVQHLHLFMVQVVIQNQAQENEDKLARVIVSQLAFEAGMVNSDNVRNTELLAYRAVRVLSTLCGCKRAGEVINNWRDYVMDGPSGTARFADDLLQLMRESEGFIDSTNTFQIQPHEPTTILSQRAQEVWDILDRQPPNRPMTGKQILEALSQLSPPVNMSENTFYTHIVPQLRQHGAKSIKHPELLHAGGAMLLQMDGGQQASLD